jgi:hypothetical protein
VSTWDHKILRKPAESIRADDERNAAHPDSPRAGRCTQGRKCPNDGRYYVYWSQRGNGTYRGQDRTVRTSREACGAHAAVFANRHHLVFRAHLPIDIPNPVTVLCLGRDAADCLAMRLFMLEAPHDLIGEEVTFPGDQPGFLIDVVEWAAERDLITDEAGAKAISDMEAGLPKPEPRPGGPVVDAERVLEFFARTPRNRS